MSSTPSRNIRRVLGEVAVNVGGTPSKAHLLSPSKTDNIGNLKEDNKKHEIETTVCSIGKKRSFDEVDDGALTTETARPFFKTRSVPQGGDNMILDVPAMEGPDDDNQSTASALTVVLVRAPASPRKGAQPDTSSNVHNQNLAEAMESPKASGVDCGEILGLALIPKERVSTPETRAAAKLHAEQLRARLKLAMYKVRTNQAHLPMSELQFPLRKSEISLPAPSTVTSTAPKNLPQDRPLLKDHPRLLPAPVLVPTAYSSRHLTQPYMPSSPPDSASTTDHESSDDSSEGEGEDLKTPVAVRTRGLLHPPMQLSSPPSSRKKDSKMAKLETDGNLTSSVVKGRAANGLLDLMKMG